MNMCVIPHTPSPIDLKRRDNVGLLNPTQLLGRKRDAYPSPTRGSTNGGMLIPASKGAHWVWSSRQCGIAQSSPKRKRNAYPSPPRGQHKWGDAYHCPASPAPQRGSTNGGMLIPAQQAQPHKGVAQMGRCLSLPCKPSPTGSTNGGMLIPAQQAQPHQGAAQMGGCLSLTSKGAQGPSSA